MPKPSTGKMLGIVFGSMVVVVMLFMMVAALVGVLHIGDRVTKGALAF